MSGSNLSHYREQLRATLDDPEFPDRETFCRLFERGQRYLQLTDLEIAKALQISRPTVNRWVTGVAAVHPIGRKPILNWLLRLADTADILSHHPTD